MGGVASAIGDAFSAVGDAVESVGDLVEDVGKAAENAVNDAGTWIDDNVIQPIKENPIETAVMVAAVAYGGPLAASYLGTSAAVGTSIAAGVASAGIAASKGAEIEDILKAGAIGAGAGAIGGYAGEVVAGEAGATAGQIAKGAATGGAGAAATGRDPLAGILIGGATAGIAEGVNYGVNEATSYLNSTLGDFSIGEAPTRSYEFGIKPPDTLGTNYSEFGLRATMPTTTPDQLFGVEVPSVPSYEYGIKAPTSTPITQLYGDYGNIQTTQIGGKGTYKEFGLDPNKEGGIGLKYDPESTAKFGELDYSLPEGGVPSTYVLGSETNPWKEEAKKILSKSITGTALSGVLGSDRDNEMGYLTWRRKGYAGGADEYLAGDTDMNVNLTAVQPDKFELRKYANPEGASTLISFKDNKPQQPIPEGYKEVETIGAAKGGLIDSTKSETMVKYSKKPLVAPRKPELTKKKKTTRKGLAAKQS